MRACLLHLGCFLILLLAPVVAAARTLRVPADYPSIQYAINVGTAGDTVLVSPGVYNESVNFAGKNLYLASVAGPAATRIEAARMAKYFFKRFSLYGWTAFAGFILRRLCCVNSILWTKTSTRRPR